MAGRGKSFPTQKSAVAWFGLREAALNRCPHGSRLNANSPQHANRPRTATTCEKISDSFSIRRGKTTGTPMWSAATCRRFGLRGSRFDFHLVRHRRHLAPRDAFVSRNACDSLNLRRAGRQSYFQSRANSVARWRTRLLIVASAAMEWSMSSFDRPLPNTRCAAYFGSRALNSGRSRSTVRSGSFWMWAKSL